MMEREDDSLHDDSSANKVVASSKKGAVEKERPWKRFAETTTGHGFARMVDANEPWRLRIFWGLVVIFLAICLFTSVSIISYESLVLIGLRREFIVQNNDTMFLPDIHICKYLFSSATS